MRWGRKGKSSEWNQWKTCGRNQVHGAKLFLSLKILQHKMLNMFRGHLLNLEVLIMGDKYHIFQQSSHCFCKRQNSSLRPDDSSFVFYCKYLFMLWDSNFSIICPDNFTLPQKSFMISERLYFRDTLRIFWLRMSQLQFEAFWTL